MGSRFLLVPNSIQFAVLSFLLLFACGQDKSILNEKVYEGPLLEMDSVETMYSDEGKIRIIIKAPKELSFDGGNKEWPMGLYLEIYDTETGALTTTFRSDRAFYNEDEDYYKGEGDVVVINLETGDELTTEELYWSQKEERYYTERFVTIKEGDELHTGEGLTASQDFLTYEITKPSGVLPVEEE